MLLFHEILDDLNAMRAKRFASDPERQEVLSDATMIAVVRLLQRLAENEDAEIRAQK